MRRGKFKFEDYNKKDPSKDATKYFIIYEGEVKEPNYFQAFNEAYLDTKTAYIHHILENNSGIIGNTPLKLKERASTFISSPPENLKITPSHDDKFRFVLDVDKHPREHIQELKDYCDSLADANLYISNFCFEIWLWSHVEDLSKITATKSSELKTELGTLNLGDFPDCFINYKLIKHAIEVCEKSDTNKTDFFPSAKSSKVYVLIQELLSHSLLDLEVNSEKEL